MSERNGVEVVRKWKGSHREDRTEKYRGMEQQGKGREERIQSCTTCNRFLRLFIYLSSFSTPSLLYPLSRAFWRSLYLLHFLRGFPYLPPSLSPLFVAYCVVCWRCGLLENID